MVTSVFWVRWLLAACGGVVLFGLLLALAPDLARAGFSWMVYGEPQTIDRFGAEAARYIGLAHAVMGSLMVGWGLALAWVVKSLVRRGSRLGWNIVAVSLLAWFVPDTAASLAFGVNDMGSTMIEENVVSAAGTAHQMMEPQIAAAIRDAGFVPMRRTMSYERLGGPLHA